MLGGIQTACADATDVYKLASKSVVVVFAENSQGSGVLLSPQIVATNCHVVGDSTEAVVEFFGKKTRATLVGENRQNDVCVLQLQSPFASAVAVRAVRRIRAVEVGEQIYAIGAPVGFKYSITGGIVSQLREQSGGTVIQFDAAVSNGNSGGGLFDAAGNLLGLPSFVKTANPFSGNSFQNLNFAWSVDVFPSPAAQLVDQLNRSSVGKPIDVKQAKVRDSGIDTPPPSRTLPKSQLAREFEEAFSRQDYKRAKAIAEDWTRAETVNADAVVARARGREALQTGSGADDFRAALRLNQSHQGALFHGAKAALAAGDNATYLRFKLRLQSLNPDLARLL